MGELGTITTGNTPSTSIPGYYSSDGIIWVTPTDIVENITVKSARKLSPLGQKVGRVVPQNTILVTCIASIGKNTMLGIAGSFNQQINGLTPNENKYNPYFLLTESFLWSVKMKNSAAAGTMQIVNRTEFSELKTWLPSLKEQKQIGSFFQQLDNLITLHQRKYLSATNIKKMSLLKFFSLLIRKLYRQFTNSWEQRKFGDLYERVTEKNDLTYGIDKSITVASMQYKKDGCITNEDYLRTYTICLLGDIVFEGHQSKQFRFGRFVENDLGNGIVSHIFRLIVK